MAGLYLHIPFCKQACYYCDFHFSTNQSKKREMVQAICREIELQKEYLQSPLETIYFGGGTPSLLTQIELDEILDCIYQTFEVIVQPEITLEANPDDLTKSKLVELAKSKVNRLSIGIQSFYQPHLGSLNRAHNSTEAETCVKYAQDAGFENITIDLIYAIPYPNHSIWETDLQKALALKVPHISAYSLTVEENTVLGNWVRKGKWTEAENEFAAQQFETLVQTLETQGYEQYEISNFALPNCYAQHNSNYWKQVPYLGVGPSAHSYNGKTRQFNVRNNAQYLKAIDQNILPFEMETLTKEDQVNEYLMTSLRTKWGCDLQFLQSKFHYDLLKEQRNQIESFIQEDRMILEHSHLYLTKQGKLIADSIASALFLTA